MERRRRILSILLLAVFLPAMLVSSLHHHNDIHDSEVECEDCVHHIPHAGHLIAHNGCLSECVLCHFLALTYVPAHAAELSTPTIILAAAFDFFQEPFIAATFFHGHTRAPPVAELSL